MIRLFDRLEIETISSCNRRCPTCLRNAYPDKDATARYFTRPPQALSATTVRSILTQAADLGFTGAVVLSLYNEPLLDWRLPQFAAFAKSLDCFAEIFICTNGDYLTPARAVELDGVLDSIRIALYDKPERGPEMRSWFSKTRVTLTGGRHIPRHYTPGAPSYPDQPCEMESQLRCMIASDGTLRLCCEDIAGGWNLGSVRERTLESLWYGEPHRSILERLQHAGGREGYCKTCPQPNVPYWSAGAQLLTSGDA